MELIKKVHDKAQKDLAEAREMLVRQRDKILRDRQNDPNSILHPGDPFLKIVAPRPGELLEIDPSIIQEPSELQAAVFDKSRGVTTTISTSTVPTTTVNATANKTRDGQVWKWGKQSYGEGEGLTGEEKWGAGEEEAEGSSWRKGKKKKWNTSTGE